MSKAFRRYPIGKRRLDTFLESVTIKGFKSIASVEDLKLGKINVLIGPNGCGKSNFIGAFALLRELHEGRLPH